MKKSSILNFLKITFFILGLAAISSCSKKSKNNADDNRSNEVTVYAYSSFASEWGAGPEIETLFKQKMGLNLVFVDCGDGIQVLSRAVLEKDNVRADVILGLDNIISKKAIESGILSKYQPKNAENLIPADVVQELSPDWFLTPFDYSHFAMIYDTNSDVPCPLSLEDLTDRVYEKKIILMDPRLSTPGFGFVAWTVSVFGEKTLDYWKSLKPNILTMAPEWSSGYGLFKQGEAPLVISYATSPAVHVEYDNTDRYVAAIFSQGHILQVEGAGILNGAPNRKGAELFMDFLISDDAQKVLPLTQFMYPVNKNAELPESYKTAAPVPQKTLPIDADATNAVVEEIMKILTE